MKTTILALFLLATTIIFAQKLTDKEDGECPLSVGQNQINAGVGLSSWGIPIYVGIDHCFKNDLTFGAEVSFRQYHNKWAGYYYDESVIGIYANCNYHFNKILGIPPIWDFYLGVNLGFNMWTGDYNYSNSHSSGIGIGGQIGVRYYFSDKLGINLEAGSGNAFSGSKLGISFKL